MRLTVFFLTSLLAAQTVTVEREKTKRGYSVRIRNARSAPLLAYAVLGACGERGSGQWEFQLSLACEPAEIRLKTAIFADGTTDGDPDALCRLFELRRGAFEDASAAIEALRTDFQRGGDRGALIREMERFRARPGSTADLNECLPGPDLAPMLVAHRAIQGLKSPDKSVWQVLEDLEEWRNRIQSYL